MFNVFATPTHSLYTNSLSVAVVADPEPTGKSSSPVFNLRLSLCDWHANQHVVLTSENVANGVQLNILWAKLTFELWFCIMCIELHIMYSACGCVHCTVTSVP